jgi:chromosome partitioning protein
MMQMVDEPVGVEKPERGAGTGGVRRLLVSSPKGGTAKTTASRNIAVLAAQDGLHVAAVDFDPQQSLGHWWSRRPKAAAPMTYFEASAGMAADICEIDGHDLVVIDTPPGIEFQPAAIRALVKAAHFVLVPTNQYSPDLASVEEWMRFLKEEGAQARLPARQHAPAYEILRGRQAPPGQVRPPLPDRRAALRRHSGDQRARHRHC